MATSTRQVAVPPDEPEARVAVIEIARAKSDRVKLPPEMILMARSTLPAKIGVEPAATVYACSQRRVATQAFGRRNAPLADLVAVCTIPNAFQLSVGSGQLPGRDKLRAHILRSHSEA